MIGGLLEIIQAGACADCLHYLETLIGGGGVLVHRYWAVWWKTKKAADTAGDMTRILIMIQQRRTAKSGPSDDGRVEAKQRGFGERADEETSSCCCCCCTCGGGEEELEEGVWSDAGEAPLESLEQRELHVPDGGPMERVPHHLFNLELVD